MYFPTLKNMRIIPIDDFLIRKLDLWLVSRRKAIRKFLNPLQFTLDTNVDEDIAISMFLFCTDPKINILRQKFTIECPNCNKILKTVYAGSEIPDFLVCEECGGLKIKVNNEIIYTAFELITSPSKDYIPNANNNSTFSNGDSTMGKHIGLRVDKLAKSPKPMHRRLIDLLDERYKSTS